MRTLESELTRTADQLNEVAHQIPDRSWRSGKSRTWGVLRPMLAGLAVVALVAVPAYLMGQDPVDVAGGAETSVPSEDHSEQQSPVGEVDEQPGDSTLSTVPPASGWTSGLTLTFERAGLAIQMDHPHLEFASAPADDPLTGGQVGLFAVGSDVLSRLGWSLRDGGAGQVWPARGADGELLLYEDGTVTIRGDKTATLLRHVESHEVVGLRWTESPGVDLVLVSVVGDIFEQAEGIMKRTLAEHQRHFEELDERYRQELEETPSPIVPPNIREHAVS
jgi:hypothetical protein